jgi:hypothetical protein
MTQLYRSACCLSNDVLLVALASSLCSNFGSVGVFSDEAVRFKAFSLVLSFVAIEVELALADVLPQSNAVPGVLGVLLAEPKEAKAPVPRPKLANGEATLAVFSGVLRGLRLPWELSPPPKRDLVAENTRVDVSRELSLSLVESESLLFLRQKSAMRCFLTEVILQTLSDESKDCLGLCP